MRSNLFFIAFIFLAFTGMAQTNIIVTNPEAEIVMKGLYNPGVYNPAKVINHPDSVSNTLLKFISTDSLHVTLDQLATFYTRHSASDTVSNLTGIGAARRWAFKKFYDIGNQNNHRLIASYLQFDNPAMCNVLQHRDIFGVLPGSDTSDKSVIIVEAHIDSRCRDVCDSACLAQGMEDNASGTALVLELARVMSKCVFNRTIVFLLVTGEEQGLYGSEAFAVYCQQKGIKIRAVLNNDIVGGIICGNTSSPPSCPGYGDIDSTHVRLFSYGAFNSTHKQYARFVKLEYKELVMKKVAVPTDIQIMTAEDRTGRGGDHISFRQHAFTAIRMTSANENGSANTSDTSYHDRQHTSDDILGLDTKPDPGLDSFFVDFNYLARNTLINAIGVGMAASGPLSPDLSASVFNGNKMIITITKQGQYKQYRIGLRSVTNDWDSVYTFSNKLIDTIDVPAPGNYYISVASVDENGIESLFSREILLNKVGINASPGIFNGVQILSNTPNPSDENTIINIISEKNYRNNTFLAITDIQGKMVQHIPLEITAGLNEITYHHGFHAKGTYWCTLYLEGTKGPSIKLIFVD